MPKRSLVDHFSALEGPRQSWKVIYPLPEVPLTVLCATMAGTDDFVEIALWGNRKLDFLRRFLPFENSVPSHDTLNVVDEAGMLSTRQAHHVLQLSERHGAKIVFAGDTTDGDRGDVSEREGWRGPLPHVLRQACARCDGPLDHGEPRRPGRWPERFQCRRLYPRRDRLNGL